MILNSKIYNFDIALIKVDCKSVSVDAKKCDAGAFRVTCRTQMWISFDILSIFRLCNCFSNMK